MLRSTVVEVSYMFGLCLLLATDAGDTVVMKSGWCIISWVNPHIGV